MTRAERKQLHHDRLEAAINALADLYEYGHLTAVAWPDELLMQAVNEIKASREERKKAAQS